MKKITFILLFLILTSISGDFKKDDVIGIWLTQEEKGKFSIYEKDGKFFGMLIWAKDPDAIDDKNPDEALRDRKLVGSEILTGFEWDGEMWVDGEIYDPNEGATYSCKMWLEDKNKLKIRGYVGISLLGRTVTWTRER